MSNIEKKLSMTEWAQLKECEEVIKRGQQTFVEVGLALAQVRDGKLYREKYESFTEYCEHKWGWTRQRAQQLLESAEIVRKLPQKASTMVDTERAARALKNVPEEQRAEVIEVAASGNGKVTAKSIEQATEKMVDAVVVLHDLTDCEREVPAEIADLWTRAQETADDILSKLRAVKSVMKDGINNRETDLVFADCTNGDLSPIEQAIGTVNLGVKPHAVCPTCNGTKARKSCKLCRGRGYIGKHKWTTCVPEETKQLLAKAKRK